MRVRVPILYALAQEFLKVRSYLEVRRMRRTYLSDGMLLVVFCLFASPRRFIPQILSCQSVAVYEVHTISAFGKLGAYTYLVWVHVVKQWPGTWLGSLGFYDLHLRTWL